MLRIHEKRWRKTFVALCAIALTWPGISAAGNWTWRGSVKADAATTVRARTESPRLPEPLLRAAHALQLNWGRDFEPIPRISTKFCVDGYCVPLSGLAGFEADAQRYADPSSYFRVQLPGGGRWPLDAHPVQFQLTIR